MKSINFFFVFITFTFLFFTNHISNAQEIKKITPPSGIHIGEDLFIDKEEISFINYLEYLFYLHKDSSQSSYYQAIPEYFQYLLVHPDSIQPYSNHMVYYYHYPITDISYEQAINYCFWRSEIVSNKMTKELPDSIHKKIVVEYRLPSIEEWRKAAYAGNEAGLGFKTISSPLVSIRKPKEYYSLTDSSMEYKPFKTLLKSMEKEAKIVKINSSERQNHPFFKMKKEKVERVLGLDFINSYDVHHISEFIFANDWGIYGMFGNVAEMTDRRGIAVGGSFEHSLNQCLYGDQMYTYPKYWLGFRCICSVKLIDIEENETK